MKITIELQPLSSMSDTLEMLRNMETRVHALETKIETLLKTIEDLKVELGRKRPAEDTSSIPAKKRKVGKNYKCWKCGKVGDHLTEDCPDKENIEGYPHRPEEARNSKLHCWKCGGNHLSNDCPDKDKIEGWPCRPADA